MGAGGSTAPGCCPLPDRAHAGTRVCPKARVYLGVPLAVLGGTCSALATPVLPMHNYLQAPTPTRVPQGDSWWAGCPEHPWVPMPVSTSSCPRFYPSTAPSPSLPQPKSPLEPPLWLGHLGPVLRVLSALTKAPGPHSPLPLGLPGGLHLLLKKHLLLNNRVGKLRQEAVRAVPRL